MKKISFIKTMFLSLLSIAFVSCEKDGKFKEYVYPEPKIESIYPASGYVASQVALIGEDFGDRMEPVEVMFGNVKATNIISCNNNRIIVEVPEGAESGKITLNLWTHSVQSSEDFTVIPTPTIQEIVSSTGDLFAQENDVISVLGSAFGNSIEKVQVAIGGMTAEVTSVTENEIKFKIPAGFKSGQVVITVDGYEVEGTSLINPNVEGDVTDLFLQNSKQPFQRADASDSEWGTALYWTANSNFEPKALHFTEDEPDGMLVLRPTSKSDGAYYQIISLPEGEYTFKVTVEKAIKGSGRYGARFAVTKSSGTFPILTGSATWDFVENDYVIGNIDLTPVVSETTEYSCDISLEETTTLTVGFATMLWTSNEIHISGISLERSVKINN